MFLESQNPAIVRTELDTVFMQNFAYDMTDPGIATASSGDLFRPIPIDRLAYIGQVNKASGLWNSVTETQTVPTSTPKVTNKFVTNVLDFADSIELSKNMFDDNMHGVWAEDVRQFALMARVTQDQNAFKLFRGAFTTQLTPDGVSIVNAAHPLIGGGTTSNLISGALSETTLFNAVTALRLQVNQAGVILGGTPKILLVPPALMKLAIQLTDSVLVSDSGNNAVNFYRSMLGITVMSSPYFSAAAGGSDTAWFLMSQNHACKRIVRQGIETALRDWRQSNNRTYLYQGNFREEVACYDYSGLVGSTG